MRDTLRSAEADAETGPAPRADSGGEHADDAALARAIHHAMPHYAVLGVLGEGGMGTVFRVRHGALEREFAVKVLHGSRKGDREATARFRREARLAASVASEHVVHVFDAGRLHDGSPYYVMEHVPGPSLATVLRERGALPSTEVAQIGWQIANALGDTHAAGVVHRDFKPSNVMLGRRRNGALVVKLLDFGIAHDGSSDEALTQTGQVMGTPHYMSPEQCRGATFDARSDQYSFGVVLYEMVTGEVPFHGGSPATILGQHVRQAPPTFAKLPNGAAVDPQLVAIIERCLEKDPRKRFASMDEVAAALARIAAPAWSAPAPGLGLPSDPGALSVPRAGGGAPRPPASWAPSQGFAGRASQGAAGVSAGKVVSLRASGRSPLAARPRRWAFGAALLLSAALAAWAALGDGGTQEAMGAPAHPDTTHALADATR